MVTRILLSGFMLFGSSFVFAQCPSQTSSSEPSESSSEPQTSPWYKSENDSESWSADRDDEGFSLPFRIGYGQHYAIASSSRTLENSSGLEIDKSWLTSRPLNVIEMWFRVGKNKKAAFGYSIMFRKLGKYESSTTINPPADMTGNALNPLTYEFEKKANTFGGGMFYEYSIFGQDEDVFRLTGRMDLGMTSYSYSTSVSYKDTCGCGQRPLSLSENSKAVFSAKLGIGAEVDFGFIGIKGLIGYEMQANNSFITKSQFDSWQGNFDQREYNYNGMPDKSRFSIPGYSDDEKIRSRNGFLYLGLSVWINLQRNDDF